LAWVADLIRIASNPGETAMTDIAELEAYVAISQVRTS
jgi:hypothetical protein